VLWQLVACHSYDHRIKLFFFELRDASQPSSTRKSSEGLNIFILISAFTRLSVFKQNPRGSRSPDYRPGNLVRVWIFSFSFQRLHACLSSKQNPRGSRSTTRRQITDLAPSSILHRHGISGHHFHHYLSRLRNSWHCFSLSMDFLTPAWVLQPTILIITASTARINLFSRDAIYQGIYLAIRSLEFGITEQSSWNYHLI
jgi:hypothetical protein